MQQAGVDVGVLEYSTQEAMIVASKQALMLVFWETVHKRR